ncbi:MAG: sigma-70 family RNA polymerase sigma factor [Clostridium sp.]|nr:sigma-70 family RNA polymerase sigma factor [Clostridium sp.]
MDSQHVESLVTRFLEDNDLKAKEELIESFIPFIKKFSKSIFIYGYDKYDIENECYKALLRALTYYNSRSNTFVAFAIRTIKNSLYEILRKSKARESAEGKEALIFTDTLENTLLSQELPIEEQIYKTLDNLLLKDAIDKLSPNEKVFINYIFINKKTLREYAKEYHMTYKEALALRMRILRKLRKIIGGKDEFNLYMKG